MRGAPDVVVVGGGGRDGAGAYFSVKWLFVIGSLLL